MHLLKPAKQLDFILTLKKTLPITNSRLIQDSDIKVDNKSLQKVAHYNSVGQLIFNNTIQRRREQNQDRVVSFRWGKLHFQIEHSNDSEKIYNQYILLTVIYGLENWNLMKGPSNELKQYSKLMKEKC